MKKETYYFSHDSNALTDTKILNMRADYGLEGYGLYWAIIEMMRNEEDYQLEFSKNTFRAIKTLTNTTIDIEKYIKDCIEDYKLFQQQDEKFYSNSLLKRMLIKDKKSAIAREKAQKRWNSNAIDMQEQCPSNANKEKEIKENKIKNKRKEEKEFVPPSLEDVKKYVLDKKLSVEAEQFYNFFTEGNWIDSKGNKVKNWKQKILTWNGYSSKDKKDTKKETFEQRQYSSEQFESLYAN